MEEKTNQQDQIISKGVSQMGNKKSTKKIFYMILGIAVALVLIPSGIYFAQNKKSPLLTQQKTQISPTQKQTIDETANWKTYKNKMNRFIFKYPPNFSIKEDIGGDGSVFYTNLKNSREEFRFEVGSINYNGWFEHFKSNQTKNINNIVWYIIPASEYCDAGNCGQTASGYYVKQKNYYVGVSEFKKIESSQTLDQILSTFKFTE